MCSDCNPNPLSRTHSYLTPSVVFLAPMAAPAGVYLMSPMLHSLTRNVSEDSVIAMIAGLCITHLFLHDYK